MNILTFQDNACYSKNSQRDAQRDLTYTIYNIKIMTV